MKALIYFLSIFCAVSLAIPGTYKIAVGDLDRTVYTGSESRATPDGYEIITVSDDGALYVFKNDRTLLKNWPYRFNEKEIVSSPVLHDLDNDGIPEIVVLTRNGGNSFLYRFNAQGLIGQQKALDFVSSGDIVPVRAIPSAYALVVIPDNGGSNNIYSTDCSSLLSSFEVDKNEMVSVAPGFVDNDREDLLSATTGGVIQVDRYNQNIGDFERRSRVVFSGKKFYASPVCVQDGFFSKKVVAVSFDGTIYFIDPNNGGETHCNLALNPSENIITSPIIVNADADADPEILIVTTSSRVFVCEMSKEIRTVVPSFTDLFTGAVTGLDINNDEKIEIARSVRGSGMEILSAFGVSDSMLEQWGKTKHDMGYKIVDRTTAGDRVFSPNNDNQDDVATFSFERYKEAEDNELLRSWFFVYDNNGVKVHEENRGYSAAQNDGFTWNGFKDGTTSAVVDGSYTYVYGVESKSHLDVKEIRGTVVVDTAAPTISYTISDSLFDGSSQSVTGINKNTTVNVTVTDTQAQLQELIITVFDALDNSCANPVRTFTISDLALLQDNNCFRKTYALVWDGKDNNGHFTPKGIYVCRISVRDAAANASSLKTTSLLFNGTIGTYISEQGVQIQPYLIIPDGTKTIKMLFHPINTIFEKSYAIDELTAQNISFANAMTVSVTVSVYGERLTVDGNGNPQKEVTSFDLLSEKEINLLSTSICDASREGVVLTYQRNIDNNTSTSKPEFRIDWTGKNLAGSGFVLPDTYFLKIAIKDKFGNMFKNSGSCIIGGTEPAITSLESLGNGLYAIRGIATKPNQFYGFTVSYSGDGGNIFYKMPLVEKLQSINDKYIAKQPVSGETESGSDPMRGGRLAIWDTFGMTSGNYILRLTMLGATASGDEKYDYNVTPAQLSFSTVMVRDFKSSYDIITPNGDGMKDATAITFKLSQPINNAALEVYSGTTLVGTIALGARSAGGNVYIFDGTLNGTQLADGEYTLYLVNGTNKFGIDVKTIVRVQRTPINGSMTLNSINQNSIQKGHFYTWRAKASGTRKPTMRVTWDLDIQGRQSATIYPKIPISLSVTEGYKSIGDFTVNGSSFIKLDKDVDWKDYRLYDISWNQVGQISANKGNRIAETNILYTGYNNWGPVSININQSHGELVNLNKNGVEYSLPQGMITCDVQKKYMGLVGYKIGAHRYCSGDNPSSCISCAKKANGDWNFDFCPTSIVQNEYTARFPQCGTEIIGEDHNGLNITYSLNIGDNYQQYIEKNIVYSIGYGDNIFVKIPGLKEIFEQSVYNLFSEHSLMVSRAPSAHYTIRRYFNTGIAGDNDILINNPNDWLYLLNTATGEFEKFRTDHIFNYVQIDPNTKERFIEVKSAFLYQDQIPWPLSAEAQSVLVPSAKYNEISQKSQQGHYTFTTEISLRNDINGQEMNFDQQSILTYLNQRSGQNFPTDLNHLRALISIKNIEMLDENGVVIAKLSEDPSLLQDVSPSAMPNNSDNATDLRVSLRSTKQYLWVSPEYIRSSLQFLPLTGIEKTDGIDSVGYYPGKSTCGYTVPSDVESAVYTASVFDENGNNNENVTLEAVNGMNIKVKRIGTGANTKTALALSGSVTMANFKYLEIELASLNPENTIRSVRKLKIADGANSNRIAALGNNGSFNVYADITGIEDGNYRIIASAVNDSGVIETTGNFSVGSPICISDVKLMADEVAVTGGVDPLEHDMGIQFTLSEDSPYANGDDGVVVTIQKDGVPRKIMTVNGTAGVNMVLWDGKDDSGQALVAGTYSITINADNKDGLPRVQNASLSDTKSIVADFQLNSYSVVYTEANPNEIYAAANISGKKMAQIAYVVNKTTTSDITANVSIRDGNNVAVRSLNGISARGTNYLFWDGRNDVSAFVPSGNYQAEVSLKDSSGVVVGATKYITITNKSIDNSGNIQASLSVDDAKNAEGVIPGTGGTYFSWGAKVINGRKAKKNNLDFKIVSDWTKYPVRNVQYTATEIMTFNKTEHKDTLTSKEMAGHRSGYDNYWVHGFTHRHTITFTDEATGSSVPGFGSLDLGETTYGCHSFGFTDDWWNKGFWAQTCVPGAENRKTSDKFDENHIVRIDYYNRSWQTVAANNTPSKIKTGSFVLQYLGQGAWANTGRINYSLNGDNTTALKDRWGFIASDTPSTGWTIDSYSDFYCTPAKSAALVFSGQDAGLINLISNDDTGFVVQQINYYEKKTNYIYSASELLSTFDKPIRQKVEIDFSSTPHWLDRLTIQDVDVDKFDAKFVQVDNNGIVTNVIQSPMLIYSNQDPRLNNLYVEIQASPNDQPWSSENDMRIVNGELKGAEVFLDHPANNSLGRTTFVRKHSFTANVVQKTTISQGQETINTTGDLFSVNGGAAVSLAEGKWRRKILGGMPVSGWEDGSTETIVRSSFQVGDLNELHVNVNQSGFLANIVQLSSSGDVVASYGSTISVSGITDPRLANLYIEIIPQAVTLDNGSVFTVGDLHTVDLFRNNTNSASGSALDPQIGQNDVSVIRIDAIDADIQRFVDGSMQNIAQIRNNVITSTKSVTFGYIENNLLKILRPGDSLTLDPVNNIATADPYSKLRTLGFLLNDAYEKKYIDIKGVANAASFQNYTIEYGAGINPGSWTRIIQSAQPVVTTGVMGRWDITGLNGVYTLLLSVRDNAGVKLYSTIVTIGDAIDASGMHVVWSPYKKASITFSDESLVTGDEVYLVNSQGNYADVVVYGDFKSKLPTGAQYIGSTITAEQIKNQNAVGIERIIAGDEAGAISPLAENINVSFTLRMEDGVTAPSPNAIKTGIAANNHIVINEIYWGPHNTPQYNAAYGKAKYAQFIELYNPTASTVDLSGYIIGDGEGEGMIPAGQSIAAGGTYVIARDADVYFERFAVYPNLEWDSLQYDGIDNAVPNLLPVLASRPVVSMELDKRGDEVVSIIPRVGSCEIKMPGNGTVPMDDFIYDFKPDGLQFNEQSKPTICYYGLTKDLNGIDPGTIHFGYINYDVNNVEPIESFVTIDSSTGTYRVYAELAHFSEYVVLGSIAKPAKPEPRVIPPYINQRVITLSGNADPETPVHVIMPPMTYTNIPSANSNFTCLDVRLNEGLNTISVKAMNALGRESDIATVTTIRDTVAPVIEQFNVPTYYSPNNDGVFDILPIYVFVNEPVDAHLQITTPDGTIKVLRATEEHDFTSVIKLNFQDASAVEGVYTCTLLGKDRAGNDIAATELNRAKFVLDITPPSIALVGTVSNISPDGDGRMDTTTFSVVVKDQFTAHVPCTVSIMRDDAILRNYYFTNATMATVTWDGKDIGGNVAVNGIYTIRVSATDLAGNNKTGIVGSFVLDTSKVEPAANVQVAKKYMRPGAMLQYSFIQASSVPAVVGIVNGAGDTVLTISSNLSIIGTNRGECNAPVKDGTYVLVVRSFDQFGHESVASMPFTVDGVKPSIELRDDFLLRTNTLYIGLHGSIFDTNMSRFYFEYKKVSENTAQWNLIGSVDGKSVVNTDVYFWNVSMLEGRYQLRVVAVDMASNENSVTYQPILIVPDSGQNVVFESPEYRMHTNNTVNYRANSDLTATVILVTNDIPVRMNEESRIRSGLSGMYFDFSQYPLFGIADGSHTIAVHSEKLISDAACILQLPMNGNGNNYSGNSTAKGVNLLPVLDRGAKNLGALHFEDSLRTIKVNGLDVCNEMTLSAWIKTVSAGEICIFSDMNDIHSAGVSISLMNKTGIYGNAAIIRQGMQNGERIVAIPGLLDLSTWTYVAVALSATNVSLYTNGVLAGKASISESLAPFFASGREAVVGALSSSGGISSDIDDLRIITNVRTATMLSDYQTEIANYLVSNTTKVSIDRTPPELIVQNPRDFDVVSGSLTIEGIAGDAHFDRYVVRRLVDASFLDLFVSNTAVNRSVLATIDTKFLNAKETFQIEAYDTFGNSTLRNLMVNIDKSIPIFEIIEPVGRPVVRNALPVQLHVENLHTNVISMHILPDDNSVGMISLGNFSFVEGMTKAAIAINQCPGDGLYTLRFRTSDGTITRYIPFVFDNSAPSVALSVTETADGYVCYADVSDTHIKSVVAEIQMGASVSRECYSGTRQLNNEAIFSIQYSDVAQNTTVSLTAIDEAGNSITKSVALFPKNFMLAFQSPERDARANQSLTATLTYEGITADDYCTFTLNAGSMRYILLQGSVGTYIDNNMIRQSISVDGTMVPEGQYSLQCNVYNAAQSYCKGIAAIPIYIDRSVQMNNPKVYIDNIVGAPYNTAVQLRYEMSEPVYVTSSIIDLKNMTIVRNLNEHVYRPAAVANEVWDCRDNSMQFVASTGAYAYRIQLEDTAGNKAEYRFPIDSIKPVLAMNILGAYTLYQGVPCISEANKLQLIAADDTAMSFFNSGLSQLSVSLNDGAVQIIPSGHEIAVSSLSDGSYQLILQAIDVAGNTNRQTNIFTVDITSPISKMTASMSPEVIDGGQNYFVGTTFELSASDSGSGISAIYYRIDSGAWNIYAQPITFVALGNHSLEWYTIDKAGHQEAVHSYPLVIIHPDRTPPVSVINYSRVPFVKDSAWYFNTNTMFTLNAVDSSGADEIPATGVAAILYRTNTGADKIYTTPFVLTEGTYTVTYYAIDNVNNTESGKNVTVYMDGTAPVTSISLRKDGHIHPVQSVNYITNGNCTLEINGQDVASSGIASGLSAIQYIKNGNWVVYTEPITITGMASDQYRITFRGVDAVGNNEDGKTVRFIIDDKPPLITVGGIVTGGYYKPGISANITVTEENIEAVMTTLDGIPYVSGTPIQQEGNHLLRVFASDKAGNQANTEISFVIDGTPPAIVFGKVINGGVYKSGLIPEITITDSALFNSGIDLNGATYIIGTPIVVDGHYRLSVSATDKADNISTKSVDFIVDGTAPIITISGVANNAYYNHPVAVSASVDDNNINSQNVLLDGSIYVNGTLIASEGMHVISVIADDKAGNKSESACSFTIDLTKPNIAISGVTNGGVYKPGVSVIVVVSDNNSDTMSIKLDGVSYTSGTPIMIEGYHTLSVLVDDKAGNSSSETRTFLIEGTPPVTTLHMTVNPVALNGTYYNPIAGKFYFTAIDPSGINNGIATGVAYTRYQIDNGIWQIYSDEQFSLPEGLHTIRYYSEDKIPNYEATNVYVIAIDATKPTMTAWTVTGNVTNAANATNRIGYGAQLLLAAIDPMNAGVSSGVKSVEYHIQGESQWRAYTAPVSLDTFNDGVSTIEYRAIDNVLNTGDTTTVVFVKDSVAPNVTILSPFDKEIVNRNTPVYANVSDANIKAYTLSLVPANGGAPILIVSNSVNTNGRIGVINTSAIANGDYRLVLAAVDAFGNSTSTSIAIRIGMPEHQLTYGNDQHRHWWHNDLHKWCDDRQMTDFIPNDKLQMKTPWDMSVSVNDFACVADKEAGLIRVLDGFGNQIYAIHTDAHYLLKDWFEKFMSPKDIAFSSTGDFYIVDSGKDRILKFRYDGQFIGIVGDKVLKDPANVAVDLIGNIYVVDRGNGKIVKFNANGGVAGIISGFKNPEDVTIANGYLYIADTGNNVIKRCGLDLSNITTLGLGTLNTPHNVTIDGFGQIVVVEKNRVVKYDTYLNPVLVFSNNTETNRYGKYTTFDDPQGVTFDRGGKYFYLSDSGNRFVEKFSLTTRDFIDNIPPVANLRTTKDQVKDQKHHRHGFNRSHGNSTMSLYGEAADMYFSNATVSYSVGTNGSTWTGIDTFDIPVMYGLVGKWDVKNLVKGWYTVKLTVRDTANNVSTDLMYVNIDGTNDIDMPDSGDSGHANSAPNAPVNVAVNKANIKVTESVRLTWTFSDANVDDTQDGFVISVIKNGIETILDHRYTDDRFTTSFDIQASIFSTDGSYSIKVKAYDNHKAESVYSAAVTVVKDSVYPLISISGVTHGAKYKGSVTPIIAVSDTYLAASSITLNGAAYTSGTAITANGTYTLVVNGTDAAGNVSGMTIEFSIDNDTPVYSTPIIIINGVTNNGCYSNPTVSVSVSGDYASRAISLDGVEVAGTSFTVSGNRNHRISVSVVDYNGYTDATNVSFIVDAAVPVITIAGMTNNGFYTPGSAATIAVNDANIDTTVFTLDGMAYASGTPVYAEGTHTLRAYAIDRAGNEATSTMIFTIDSIAPVISVSGVENGKTYNSTRTITISATDANMKRTITTMGGNPVTSPMSVANEGRYTIHIEAEDRAGNQSMADITFTIDKTMPVIIIDGVLNNATYLKANIGVRIFEDNFDLSRSTIKFDTAEKVGLLTIRTDENNMRHYAFAVSNITNAGEHTLAYTISDSADNSVTGSLKFNVVPFIVSSNLTMYASYDRTVKLDFAKGDSNEYSPTDMVVTNGFISNCIRPSITWGDKLSQYEYEKNIMNAEGTFAIWLKPDWTTPSSDGNFIFSVKNSVDSSLDVYSLRAFVSKNGGTVFTIRNKNSQEYILEVDKSIGEANRWYKGTNWTQIVFTWNFTTGQMNAYVNGVKTKSATVSGTPANNSQWILIGAGRRSDMQNKYHSFDGRMDELRVFGKALTDEEVKYLYEIYAK